jgi:predicted HTH transcriptional regulator
MHRNYMDSSCIQISVFDDRIEFQNPGGIFGDLSLEKILAGYSSVRNTQIADIFQKMNIVEKWGTGLLRIADICKEAGSSPVQYQAGSGFFMATLWRNGTAKSENVPLNVPVTELSEKEQQVLDFIIAKNDITAKEIAEKLNISDKTVKRAISTLKAHDIIVRVGSDKTGFWSVKEK